MRKILCLGLVASLSFLAACGDSQDLSSLQPQNNQKETASAAIKIKSISPDNGPVGTLVVVTGEGIDTRVDKVIVIDTIANPIDAGANSKDGQLSFKIPPDTPVGNAAIKIMRSAETSNELVFKVTNTGKKEGGNTGDGEGEPDTNSPPQASSFTAEITICANSGEYTAKWKIGELGDGIKAYLYFPKRCRWLNGKYPEDGGNHSYECKYFADYEIPYKPINYLDSAINKCLVGSVTEKDAPDYSSDISFLCSKITLPEKDEGFITSYQWESLTNRQAVLEIADETGRIIASMPIPLKNGAHHQVNGNEGFDGIDPTLCKK